MNTSWYQTLKRPPLTPPNWVFSPVWTVLYVMIAVAIVLYVRAAWKQRPYGVYCLLLVQLSSNAVWTFLFFGLKSPVLALIDIAVLDVTLVLLIDRFRRRSKPAAILLLPYLAWVGFATYLNAAFWWLN